MDGDRKGVVREMNVLNESLKHCVELIREFKFTQHDSFLDDVRESLRNIEGVTVFEDLKKDYIVFALPLSEIATKVSYPLNNEGYTLDKIIEESKAMGSKDLIKSIHCFINVLQDLADKDLSILTK